MKWIIAGLMVALPFAGGSAAHAQSSAKDTPWSAEFAIGWDNGISGNINSSGIGTLDGQTVVITKNTYDDVYGTGLHIRFGGGYLLDDFSEVRATFSFQSLDADLTPMGDIGVSRLYGQYDDYKSFGLDFGFRRYVDLQPGLRAYGEGTAGLAFIEETDVTLVAPGVNFTRDVTDFYDQTAAFTLGANAGVVLQMSSNIDMFGQLGVRWVSGMSAVDNLEGTNLETINDKSGRWTMPFLTGVRVRF
jgi:hypothetical protein